MLHFSNGEVFASGVMEYEYRPIPPDNVNNRILLQIHVEKVPALVAVDTGAPYLILAPDLANRLSIDRNYYPDDTAVYIRGVKFQGSLHRIRVCLPAAEGVEHTFDATAFIPYPDEEEKWGDLPSFLGIEYCLERIRFALDPVDNKFYFGQIPNSNSEG